MRLLKNVSHRISYAEIAKRRRSRLNLMTCSFCGRDKDTDNTLTSALNESIAICEGCTRGMLLTFDKLREIKVMEGIKRQGLSVWKREKTSD